MYLTHGGDRPKLRAQDSPTQGADLDLKKDKYAVHNSNENVSISYVGMRGWGGRSGGRGMKQRPVSGRGGRSWAT